MTKKEEKAEKQQYKKIEIDEPGNEQEVREELEKEENSEENEAEAEVEAKKELSTEEKLAELQNRYLRLSAEYDNFRKRSLKEKLDLQKSANENLLHDILPVADDFERAMQVVDEAKDVDAVKEGMRLIFGKFLAFLSQQGIKEIEALHKDFDTDLHEAVTKIPAPTKQMKGKVVDVVQKGYFLNDRILRFSKVVIGE